MSEWDHFRGRCKCIVDLSNSAVPATHVSDIAWSRKGEDVVNELFGGLDASVCNLEAQIFHGVFCKLELLGVEDDPLARTALEERANLVEVLPDIRGPQNGIINTFLNIREVTNDPVSSVCVTISG